MKKIAIALIKGYQRLFPLQEPLLRMFVQPEALACRFTPTCSQYTIDAIEKYGLIRGSIRGLKRLSRCHPGNPGGHDPLT